MNITIVGGGNVGTQFAVHCAEKGHKVTVYTSKVQMFDKHLTIIDQEGNVIHEGDIDTVTFNAQTAFYNADIIFVTTPSCGIKKVADKICQYCSGNTKIGLIPGTGGGEWAFKECLQKGAVIFGLQRVPSVARIVEIGKTVRAVGYRSALHVAALPRHMTEEIQNDISKLFDMECIALPNYLTLTLTPSNPILHTTRLRTIFRGYQEGMRYVSIPLFYEDWTDESSELLLKCDAEVQLICRALTDMDLSYVKSLRLHYESASPEALTKKIKSIEGFKGLKTPTVCIDGKYIPDFNSRYFTEDFSYGLEILSQIAGLLHIAVPNIDATLQWYNGIVKNNDKFSFRDYEVRSEKDLLELYLR